MNLRALPTSLLPTLALWTALALLAWTLAHWSWVFMTPRPALDAAAAGAPEMGRLLAEKLAGLHLFGGAAPTPAASGQALAPAASNIAVQGVYAGGGAGFAVLVVDGKAVSAVQGKEFAPGQILRAVYSDRVEIERGGRVETVAMAKAPLAAAPGKSGGAPAPSGGGLKVEVRELSPGQYGISRAEMLEALKKPDQLPLLGRFGAHPRGGAVLERAPSGGLPEKLGLKVGDVVTAMNGKSLAGPGDVMRLYEQLVSSERVSVDVLRAGEKMSLGIEVAQ